MTIGRRRSSAPSTTPLWKIEKILERHSERGERYEREETEREFFIH
jgi:hypothetical protein